MSENAELRMLNDELKPRIIGGGLHYATCSENCTNPHCGDDPKLHGQGFTGTSIGTTGYSGYSGIPENYDFNDITK
jgi:hypothetical protein